MIGISKNTEQKLLSFLQILNSGNFGVAVHVASFLRKLLGFNDIFCFETTTTTATTLHVRYRFIIWLHNSK